MLNLVPYCDEEAKVSRDRRVQWWPEVTNWPSGTHKRTKFEQAEPRIEANQSVAALEPVPHAGRSMTEIT